MFGLDLGNLLVHLKMDRAEFEKSIREVEKSMDRAARHLDAFGWKMTKYVTAPLLAVGTAATKSFASFNDAMTKSMAIMDEVSPKMREMLTMRALDISKETTSTATEIAKGYKHLASAGYSAAQSLETIAVVNKFAIAGQFDLEEATTYLADSLNALGLKSEDPIKNMKEMTRVADVLSKADMIANAEIEQFASSLVNEAGAAMKNWNINLEEGVAILAAYSDQGIKAEEAGTLFGRMLRLLMQSSNDQKSAWDAMNISIYETNGALKSLPNIIDMLTSTFAGMTVEAKVAALQMLGFQARSQQAILPLLAAGDRIRRYTDELKRAGGTMDRIAKENMSSFSSQMKIMWNNIKAVSIDIGRLLAPSILKLAESLKEATRWWQSLNDESKVGIVQMGAFAVAIGPVSLALAGMIRMMQGVQKAAAVMWLAITGPIAIVIAAIALTVAGWYALATAIRQNLWGLGDVAKEFFDGMGAGFTWLFNSPIMTFIKKFVKEWDKLFNVTAYGIAKNFWVKNAAITKTLWDMISQGPKALLKGASITDVLKMNFDTLTGDWKDVWEKNVNAAKKPIDDVEDYLVESIKDTFFVWKKGMPENIQAFKELWAANVAQIKQDFGSLAGWLDSFFAKKPAEYSSEFAKNLLGIGGNDLVSTDNQAKSYSDSFLSNLYGEKFNFVEETQKMADEEDYVRLLIKDIEMLKAKAMQVDEMKSVYGKLFDGLNERSKEYFNNQQILLNYNIERWQRNATEIARVVGVEKSYVSNLIEAYREEQQALLDIDRLKVSDNVADGFRAAGIVIRREIQTWGERAYEFTTGLTNTLENGLMKMADDWRNMGQVAKDVLKEIYMEALRISIIRPFAQQLSGAFSTVGQGIWNALSGNEGTVSQSIKPGYEGFSVNPPAAYAEGGIAWGPQIAKVAENEPEVITPFSKLGELSSYLSKSKEGSAQPNVELHVHESAGGKVDRQRTAVSFDAGKLLVSVFMEDQKNNGTLTQLMDRRYKR